MDLKIGTLNIKNNYINRIGGYDSLGNDNALILSEYIKNNKFDILGTQELTRKITKRLGSEFNLSVYGDYRYGNSDLVKKIKFFDDYNENNAIITNLDVMITETERLPWLAKNPINLVKSVVKGSIMPRVLTSTIISDDSFGEILVFNTHLDYQIPGIQISQLKRIYQTIARSARIYPTVLMGDFNLETNVPYFKEFINSLNDLGLQRVEVNTKTNEDKFSNKTAIDHIFIPQQWLINEAGLIEDKELKRVTDHKGVYVKARL